MIGGLRTKTMVFSAGLSVFLGLVLLVIPVPYIIEAPGPTFNTLGEVQGVKLIEIEGHPTYPTTGSLSLVTVSVAGAPGNPITLAEAVGGWINPHEEVIPSEFVYPSGTTAEQVQQENTAQMASSQENAIAAALHQLAIDYQTRYVVSGFLPNSPAENILEPHDILVAVNGRTIDTIDDFRQFLEDSGTTKPAIITVNRGGSKIDVQVTPQMGEQGRVQLGITVAQQYTFPFDIKIQLNNVGGPSAGLIFALGIVDMLTEGDLTGGQHIAGTGTINAQGTVGPIGGIVQKMVASSDSGASWFFAPADNCDEVVGHVPDGLRVVSVDTLEQAYEALKSIGSGVGTEHLPTCVR